MDKRWRRQNTKLLAYSIWSWYSNLRWLVVCLIYFLIKLIRFSSFLGKRFAEQDLRVLLTQILMNFTLESVADAPLEHTYETLLFPVEPIGVKFVPLAAASLKIINKLNSQWDCNFVSEIYTKTDGQYIREFKSSNIIYIRNFEKLLVNLIFNFFVYKFYKNYLLAFPKHIYR